MSYALPNREQAAEARLAALGELFDPRSRARLEALGLGAGSRVWEVGAGGPSLPAWMASRGARVLATDVDTTRLAGLAGVDVRRHELGKDPLPDGSFDVIHARLVLVHVPARDEALRALAGALAPGGWLVIEDADPALQPLASFESGPAAELANRLKTAFRALLTERGVDLAYGRTLPHRLRDAGLVDVGADAYFPLALPACAALERATIAQVGARLVDKGLATDAELAQHLGNVDAGLAITTSPMVTAWGRRA